MSSIMDKLDQANKGVPKVYDAGKSCKDMTDFRYYCYNGARLDTLNYLNTCCGTNFKYMFAGCTSLKTIPKLDTSKGEIFSNMFSGCTSLKDIPEIDTSKGRLFASMFEGCADLWEPRPIYTPSATNCAYMFSGCNMLDTIRGLDLANVTTCRRMFNNCFYLTLINGVLDLGKATDLSGMFARCFVLITVRFAKGSVREDISFLESKQLEYESVVSLVDGLYNYSGTDKAYTRTVSLSEYTWDSHSEKYRSDHGVELSEAIANLGWNYA